MKKKNRVGILKNLRKKFGEMIKIVLGRNSATNRIIAVEIMVLSIRIKRSESMSGDSTGPRMLEKTNPYITSEILLPISIVAMYWPGLSVNNFIIFDPKTPCFLSSSIRSLLEVTKAISIPEKNAESTIARSIIRIPPIHQS
jgi:hypothetical protein